MFRKVASLLWSLDMVFYRKQPLCMLHTATTNPDSKLEHGHSLRGSQSYVEMWRFNTSLTPVWSILR